MTWRHAAGIDRTIRSFRDTLPRADASAARGAGSQFRDGLGDDLREIYALHTKPIVPAGDPCESEQSSTVLTRYFADVRWMPASLSACRHLGAFMSRGRREESVPAIAQLGPEQGQKTRPCAVSLSCRSLLLP